MTFTRKGLLSCLGYCASGDFCCAIQMCWLLLLLLLLLLL